ncbi:MAG: 2-phospho-L-lactate guanylyltransferase [Hydrogenophaga sp.]|uniref:2-phospho-L-lactate guanylyltransferase n=1 Tax=Hydrogenophaga sp. TaxID=1904254 RepID=UPI00262A8DCC|nr:2-phospho-L-lactate guanylyltransferase [Hydrogenophaga sp.]MCW5668684.1 2-phospho-L-lactate guanylyltransferase [Hydrogenophaga sp.]
MHLLIPVKRFDAAKSRLAPHISSTQRAALAAAMLEDVLAEMFQIHGLTGISVVSAQSGLAEQLKGRARVLPEHRHGLNEALTAALAQLTDEGVRRVLILHGDLPIARASDVQGLVDRHRDSDALVLVPDVDAKGTNAMMCSLPLDFPLQFGPKSLERHQHAAAMADRVCTTEPIPSLALDVDDLSALNTVHAIARRGAPSLAPKTRHLLCQWGMGGTRTTYRADPPTVGTFAGTAGGCTPSTGEKRE